MNKNTESQLSRDIADLSADDQTRIRKLQPYNRGGKAREHPLWRLRVMNIIDKHRRLHLATTGVYNLETLIVHELQGVKILSHQLREGKKTGDEVLRLRVQKIPDSVEFGLKVGPVVQIEFGQGSLDIEGRSIIEVPSDAMAFIRDEVFPKFSDRVGDLPKV